MDADRFDALSRALTTVPSRRTTLGAEQGALLGSVLPGPSLDVFGAAGNGKGKGKHGHAGAKGTDYCASQEASRQDFA